MSRAIIIEDNLAAEQHLRANLLQHCPTVEILDAAATVVQGAKIMRQHQPDLLFLDIELPDGTGFDLLDILGDWSGRIIFTTGLDDQATRAFRYAAVDYLLKPIESEELVAAVARAQQLQGQRREQHRLLRQVSDPQAALPTRLALHAQDRIQLVEIKDIIRLEAESNYTSFFMASSKRLLVGKTLKGFAELLEAHGFLRVHQTHLVNPAFLTEFIKTDGGYLQLSEGTKIPVSVRRRQLVMDYLSSLG